MASVTLTNVWKIYNAGQGASEVEAVKNVNLECRNGEFLALLGPSGCGKTSTCAWSPAWRISPGARFASASGS